MSTESVMWLCKKYWKCVMASFAIVTVASVSTVRAQEDSSLVGEWSQVQSWPTLSIHAIMLPTREVLFWSYNDSQQFYLWNPETDFIGQATNPPRPLFCSAHSFLPDGTLLVSGGATAGVGLNTADIYDPYTDFWTPVPDMTGGRYYPGSTTLANGDVLVSSGDVLWPRVSSDDNNQLPQVFESEWTDWRNLTNAELSLPLYPRTFLGPDGVFFATATSRYLDTSGTGAWTDVASRHVADRDHGSAVMYEAGKVLWTGGGDPPTETCEIIDLNDSTPSWEVTGSMAQPRRQNNVTLLPDGKVLVTGGSSAPGFNDASGAVYTTEMWDPNTGQWTTMASYQVYRGYHSTALLLPDGRVLSSGGNGQPNAEVYSPPYLFNGIRPTITSAPASIDYGETFFVETADANDVGQVNMLRLGSSTHAHNFDQRFCRSDFTIETSTQLSVSAPASATACPPGPYMLFVLNSSGVPSEAEILLLAGPSNQAPVASFTYTCDSADFTCVLDASASDDADGSIANYDWDFGDGSGSSGNSGPMISPEYSKQGMYTVVLIVTDYDSQAGTASTGVRVPKKGTTSGGTDGDSDGGGSFCDTHPTHKKCR